MNPGGERSLNDALAVLPIKILEASWLGRPQKYFQGGNVDILLIPCRSMTLQCKSTFTKRFAFLQHKEGVQCYDNNKKMRSLATVVRNITEI